MVENVSAEMSADLLELVDFVVVVVVVVVVSSTTENEKTKKKSKYQFSYEGFRFW